MSAPAPAPIPLSDQGPRSRDKTKPSFLADALHIFVLTSFALAQPIYHRLAGNPIFLEDEAIRPATVLFLVLILSVLAPALVLVVEVVPGFLTPPMRAWMHAVLVALLGSAIALPLVGRVRFLPGIGVLMCSFLLGVMGAIIYGRYAWVRKFVTAASPAVLLFPGLFLCRAPVSGLLFSPAKKRDLPLTIHNPIPVVMVVFDEFCGTSIMNERREIDAIRYPNFATLAREATWYRNATSVHARTDYALPAILTGRYPPRYAHPTAAEYPPNLFMLLLSSKTYELTAFEPHTRLFPTKADREYVYSTNSFEQVRSLLADLSIIYLRDTVPLEYWTSLPSIPPHWFGVKDTFEVRRTKTTGVVRYGFDRDRDQQLDHYLECLVPSERPAFYFLHVAIPHFPWVYLPSGRKYWPDAGMNWRPFGSYGETAETWGSDELAVAHAYQRYLLQVGFVDRCIGNLIARLKAVDLYDRSLVIVTADHGVCFRPSHSRRTPTQDSLPDIMSIPLFIKAPHQREAATSERNVQSIDILPTILDTLKADPPPETDGRSLLDPSHLEPAQKLFCADEGHVTVDGAFESKYSTLERMLTSFGSGADDRLYKFGPHNELVGQQITDLGVIEPSDSEIDFIRFGNILSEDPRALVPCYFVGRLRNSPNPQVPVNLAISVNGTVSAVTRTYLEEGIRNTWSAMVPESSLRVGENDVQVFVVTTGKGKPTLARCTPLGSGAAAKGGQHSQESGTTSVLSTR